MSTIMVVVFYSGTIFMYYFALLTSDYCKYTDMSLISLFKYNDILLNIYVVDNGYADVLKYYSAKPYRDKLNIINIYDEKYNTELFSYKHNGILFDSDIAHRTLWTFRILDTIPDDQVVRLDLDIMYFGSVDQLNKYDNCMVGVKEAEQEYNNIISFDSKAHTPLFQINVGLCKFYKSKFNITSFSDEMKKRLTADSEHYYVPEQDILNELTDDKFAFRDSLVITNYTCIDNIDISKPVLGYHFNGSFVKPWKLYDYNKMHFHNYNYVCGIELCKCFCDKFDFFKREINMNSVFTRNLYISPKNESQVKMVRLTEKLKEVVGTW